MADNSDQQSFDSNANDQPDPSNEIIPVEDTETINLIQQIENMDVHHHAHHEGKKSLKSYAWEFLMLFLAVFCGFLAEYYLEHRIEKERGNQYVRSMIEDIVSDSTKINQSFEFSKKQQPGLDSLSALFNNTQYSENTIKQM